MRVLHVQKVKGIGGSERHLLELLPGLSGNGVEIAMVVLTGTGHQPFVEELCERNMTVRVLPIARDIDARVAGRIAGEVRAFGPDVIHTHLIHADLYGAMAAWRTSTPSVVTVHSSHAFYARPPYRQLVRRAWSRSAAVIAISHAVDAYIRGLGTARLDRLHVIPYGIQPQAWAGLERATERARFGLGPEGFVLAMASRLVPGKGHGAALAAVAELRREGLDARLLIAGDGPEGVPLQRRAHALRIADAVTFTGFVPDVAGVFAASDAVLFLTEPSLSEGFGLAALEAMASGRVVVATDVGPLPEVVGSAGILVDPASRDAVPSAVRALIDDPVGTQALGDAARERARREFPADRMVSRTIELYRSIV